MEAAEREHSWLPLYANRFFGCTSLLPTTAMEAGVEGDAGGGEGCGQARLLMPYHVQTRLPQDSKLGGLRA